MRVCITGGLGYLGSKLTEKLVNKGYDVSIIDTQLYGVFLKNDMLNKVKLIKEDLLSFRNGDIQNAIKESDVVIHLAGIVGDPACDLFKGKSIDINVNGTKNVIKLCEKFNKKLIFASTCSVYGACDKNSILTEKSKILPLSIYALSKYTCEGEIKRSKLKNYTIFRMGTLYGLSPRMRFDLVINTFIGKAIFGGNIEIFGGDQYRPFLHLDDACNFYLRAIEKDIFPNKIFNLGGNNFKIVDVGKEIEKRLNCKAKVIKEIKDPRNYKVDSSLAIKTFELNFKKDIPYAINEIKEAISSKLISTNVDSNYSNVEWLRKLWTKC
jgi:nucleoside-diphosphate-sugar epimerase